MRSERIISSIPKDLTGDDGNKKSQCPHINEDGKCTNSEAASNWIYPSPKMFWEAMNRKGTLPEHLKDPNSPKTQEELDWIVTIHNVVNEQCWQEISKWEKFRNSQNGDRDGAFKLQRFLGRPDDLSPRAWFKSTILGYRKPFDRHDWYVKDSDNPAEPPRRYIIDFYTGAEGGSGKTAVPASFYLDVRPALDTFDSISLRMKKFINDLFQ